MRNKFYKSMMKILIIIIPVLFSCAGVDANSYHHLGIIHMQRGDLDQAILYFNKAIELDPKSLIAYRDRGEAYAAKGEYDRAISEYTKALEINPTDALAYRYRGWTYYLKKEYNKSWKDINKAQELGYQVPPKYLDDLRKASGREK